ncbi:MAG: FtsQ-type POTRA domain-containing protein, partial [Patescibacteria group bacterium]
MTARWSKGTDHYRPSGRMIRRRLGPVSGGEKLYGRREHFWQRRTFKLLAILGGAVGLILLYIIIWSNLLMIETIKVVETATLDDQAITDLVNQELTQSRWYIFPRRQLFFVDTNTIERAITDRYVIDRVAVQRRWIKTLRVTIQEKNAQLTLLSNDRYYVLGPNGIAIRELLVGHVTLVDNEPASEEAPANGEVIIDQSALDQTIPVVHDATDAPVEINQVVIPPNTVAFIQSIAKQFPAPLTIKYFELPTREGSEVHVTT